VIDKAFLLRTLQRLLETPSPSGMTDAVVHLVTEILEEIGIEAKLSRRGAIRALLPGAATSPKRAIAAHLDTLGAMVKALKANGRLELVPIGFWSSRFAEGARVTVYSDNGTYRGTVLPLKASGHTFNREIDTQPVEWTRSSCGWTSAARRHRGPDAPRREHRRHGLDRPAPEFCDNGYITRRYLDDKAGVAALLAVAKACK
jgi:putative aminopeptidase FrvX